MNLRLFWVLVEPSLVLWGDFSRAVLPGWAEGTPGSQHPSGGAAVTPALPHTWDCALKCLQGKGEMKERKEEKQEKEKKGEGEEKGKENQEKGVNVDFSIPSFCRHPATRKVQGSPSPQLCPSPGLLSPTSPDGFLCRKHPGGRARAAAGGPCVTPPAQGVGSEAHPDVTPQPRVPAPHGCSQPRGEQGRPWRC